MEMKEIYHPSGADTPISKDNYGNEPVQYLAKRFFSLPDNTTFTQFPSSVDPRGFFDLYGEEPEKEYPLNDDEELRYHALTCFFTHISFILNNRFDCILIPEFDDVKLLMIDERDDSNIIEKRVNSREDLYNCLKGIVGAEEDKTP